MLEKLLGVKTLSQATRDIAVLWIALCIAITLICLGFIFLM